MKRSRSCPPLPSLLAHSDLTSPPPPATVLPAFPGNNAQLTLHSHTPPATFSTLPVELINCIGDFLGKRSITNLSRSSLTTYRIFESNLWRNLNLFLNINHGRQPFTGKDSRWFCRYEMDLRRHILAMKGMMNDIRSEGNRHRYSLIKSIRVAPLVQIVDVVVQLLVDVSANLEHLEVLYADLYKLPNPLSGESFETRFLQRYAESLGQFSQYIAANGYSTNYHGPNPTGTHSPTLIPMTLNWKSIPPAMLVGLSFPALTSVRFGWDAIVHPETIIALLQIAPSLHRLAFCIDNNHSPIDRTEHPEWQHFSRLRKMNTTLHTLSIEAHCDDEDRELVKSISNILEFSPLLQQLNLRLKWWENWEGAHTRIVPLIGKLSYLPDLSWQDEFFHMHGSQLGAPDSASLRRLLLPHADFKLPDDTVPTSSALEVLVLTRTWGARGSDDLVFQPAPATILPLDASFAQWIRACPRLRVVNYICDPPHREDATLFDRLDNAEAAGDVTARVYSMRHGDYEVLHAQIQLQPIDNKRRNRTTRQRVLCYTGGDRLMADFDTVEAQYPPEWQDYSDFEGEAVPMRVMRGMREAEGLNEEGWKARGVEVGAAAWGVLEAWRAAGSPAE